MYLGDLAHTSYAPDQTRINATNLPLLAQRWKINVGATISSGITVANKMLFFGDWNGNFYAVDAARGRILWSVFLGKAPDPEDSTCQPGIGVSSQPVVVGTTVYVGGGDSAVYALNRDTGEIRWRLPLADPQSGAMLWASAVVSGNSLYMGIASLGDCPLVQGGLARIGLDDPTHPLVRYLVPAGFVGASVWSTPAVDEQAGLVYVTTGNGAGDAQDAEAGIWGSALLALDATTLEIKAHFFLPVSADDADVDFGSSPTLFQAADGQQYVAANGKDGVMYVLHRPDLSPAWTFKLAVDCINPALGCGSISTPAFDGQTVYSGAGQPDSAVSPGSVYALDPVTRNPLWMYQARGVVLAPVTLTPGLVFVPSTKGLAVLDAASGTELWTDGRTSGMFSQAAVANGTVYTTYFNGDVVAWGIPGIDLQNAMAATPRTLTFRYTSGGPPPDAQSINIYASSGALGFTAASDSSWLSAGAQSGTAPAAVKIQAAVGGLAPGSYTGTLTFTPSDGGSPVAVRVSLLVNGPLPSLAAVNVANAASFASGALAPGSLFSIIANNLAGETIAVRRIPWPTSLAGVTVKINGIPAPLVYVSPTQINAQVPFEVALGAASLVVESNGASAAPVALTMVPAAPGIFLLDGTRAAATNQDFTVNGAGNPAAAGSVVSVYFTGQGQVDVPMTTGAASPIDTLGNTLAPTAATIGGQPATVIFCGLAPGQVGLGQINVQIPDLPPGDYPVVLHIGDAISNPGVISVARSL